MSESWYFAFGANMATSVFIGRNRMQPTHWEVASLREHRLAFSEPGIMPGVEPAFANVEPAEGRVVHGVLYRLPERQLERLDKMESQNYRRCELTVRGQDSGPLQATLYQSLRHVPDRRPSRRYLELLVEGAEEHLLPLEYRAWLRSHPHAWTPILSPLARKVLPLYARARTWGFRHETITMGFRSVVNRLASNQPQSKT